ncbi:MAG: aspartate--tRNA(Asn) ligase [Lachnospiraceae bacterium]|nr:aspartate--tRNA(Asn) ligase [Lachnospiraceae bacterium]
MTTVKYNTISTNPETDAYALADHIGQTVRLHGAIYKIRRMSGFAFVLLRMRDAIVQCIYSEEYASFPITLLTEEACVRLTAEVVAEERSRTGYELRLKQVQVLSTPYEDLPIVINQKKVNTSLENLLDYRPITLRNEKERAIFHIQAAICAAFREFLIAEHFTEIHSPKIAAIGAEGGANIFKLPYFGKEAYLAQSPQFYKQMMVGVFERVFEIAPVFRAEKHDTSRHLNEYTSVDFEMGYIESFEEIMATENRMLAHCISFLNEHCKTQLTLLGCTLPRIEEIPQIPFSTAKEWIANSCKRKITDMLDFEPEEERLLCELVKKETGSEFVFVTHYPSAKRPFYAMDDPKNPEETLSFDLLFRGLEITTGGQRIHSYQEQLEKLHARGMHEELFEGYLMLHKYGVPPHGGLGLGLERFTAQLLGFENVRSATLFPRDIHRLMP